LAPLYTPPLPSSSSFKCGRWPALIRHCTQLLCKCRFHTNYLFKQIRLPLAGSWSATSTSCKEKPGVIIRAKSGSALSRVDARKGIRPMEINKTAIQPNIILTNGNRPRLPQCGKEGVVLYKLHSRVVKH